MAERVNMEMVNLPISGYMSCSPIVERTGRVIRGHFLIDQDEKWRRRGSGKANKPEHRLFEWSLGLGVKGVKGYIWDMYGAWSLICDMIKVSDSILQAIGIYKVFKKILRQNWQLPFLKTIMAAVSSDGHWRRPVSHGVCARHDDMEGFR